MQIIVPDYYRNFKCIADKCRHSCCRGWEIDIDEESYDKYLSLPGPVGDKLRASIEINDEDDEAPAHFRLTEDERCPFLNHQNLCELILEAGEDCLCQICTDHPRFRNYWTGFTEIGLGFACEEAARIILSQEEKVTFEILTCSDTATPEPDDIPSDEEIYYLELREELYRILQDRRKPVDDRIYEMLKRLGIDSSDIIFEEGPLNETACEQFALYLLYRNYADVLYDGRLEERVKFTASGYMKVRNQWAVNRSTDIESLIEPARRFSEDVEYDTDTWDFG